jgi:hypothetical protein
MFRIPHADMVTYYNERVAMFKNTRERVLSASIDQEIILQIKK